MNEDLAIRLRDLTMELPTYRRVKRLSWNGLGAMQAGVGGRLNFSDGRATVTALDDVSVEIARRERVGLIGLNGAGKSTMLRVMAGIYYPTRGTAESRGRVSTLFSESLGLKPEATGIENIMLSGVSLGLTHGRVKEMIPRSWSSRSSGSTSTCRCGPIRRVCGRGWRLRWRRRSGRRYC